MRLWQSRGVSGFDPVAPFYDELMRVVPYGMWADYYKLLLARQDVYPEHLLEVCCGTGKVAEELVKEGFQVSGFDLSAPMVEEARRKAAAKGLDIRYEVMDAATFDMGRTYDAAFSFFDSLNYITDPFAFAKAIKRVGAHLPSGASFIFDLNTAYAFEERMFDQRQMHPAAKLRYQWKGDWDPETKLIHVTMKFWRKGEELKIVHVQRAHSDEEVRGCLEAAGFGSVEVFHSYTLDRPRKNTDRVHYAAVKR